MWYNIDFKKLAVSLLPLGYRKPKFIAFTKVLINPVINLHYQFLQSQKNDAYLLNHNWQVCYFRKALNDKFDTIKRRITIEEGNRFIRQYIYTKSEQKPRYLGKMYLYSASDYADTGVDFIVYVPNEIIISEMHALKATIDFFKKGVKRYKIVEI